MNSVIIFDFEVFKYDWLVVVLDMKEKQNIIDKLREENSRQINNYISQHAMDFFNEVGL